MTLTLGRGLARTRLSKFALIWRAISLLLSCSVAGDWNSARPGEPLVLAAGVYDCHPMPVTASGPSEGGCLHGAEKRRITAEAAKKLL